MCCVLLCARDGAAIEQYRKIPDAQSEDHFSTTYDAGVSSNQIYRTNSNRDRRKQDKNEINLQKQYLLYPRRLNNPQHFLFMVIQSDNPEIRLKMSPDLHEEKVRYILCI